MRNISSSTTKPRPDTMETTVIGTSRQVDMENSASPLRALSGMCMVDGDGHFLVAGVADGHSECVLKAVKRRSPIPGSSQQPWRLRLGEMMVVIVHALWPGKLLPSSSIDQAGRSVEALHVDHPLDHPRTIQRWPATRGTYN